MRLSPLAALTIYALLVTGVAAILLGARLLPRKALRIELVDRQGQVVTAYRGDDDTHGHLYYRDKDGELVIYLNDEVIHHPKAEWFAIRITRPER